MKKTLLLSLAAAGALLTAGAAEARVAWSIGIDAPGITTVVSNRPVFREAPVYVAPPVVYEQAPVYAPVPRYLPPPVVRYEPAPVGYYPQPVVRTAPVVVYPEYRHHGWRGWEHRRDERWERSDDHRDGGRRDDHGDRDRRWDGRH